MIAQVASLEVSGQFDIPQPRRDSQLCDLLLSLCNEKLDIVQAFFCGLLHLKLLVHNLDSFLGACADSTGRWVFLKCYLPA